MSEVWAAAAVTLVGGAIAGAGAEKKDKSDKKHQSAMSKEESALSAQRTSHEMALEDFYSQKERARKQRGLDQYRQMSTMGEFSPNYNAAAEPRVVEGAMPNYNEFNPNADVVNAGARKASQGVISLIKGKKPENTQTDFPPPVVPQGGV